MVRFIIVFSLSLFLSFQVYAAPKTIKQVTSQKTSPTAINVKPAGSVKPLIKKPDLVVQEFTLTPGTVQNGDSCIYKLVIKNTGGFSSVKTMLVGFNTTPQQGRNDYLKVPGPGQSLTFKGKLSAPVDRCLALTYTVTLDAHHVIDESNENNNTASKSIAVQGRPDVGFCLRPSICKELYINGGVNKQIFIGLDVYNYGCTTSPACTIDLNFPDQWPRTVQVPPIQPGKFFPYHEYMTWKTPGVRIGEIIIKYTHNDARTFNDRVKFKVNVVP